MNDDTSTEHTEIWLPIIDLMGIDGALCVPIELTRDTYAQWQSRHDPFILKQLMKHYVTIDANIKRVSARALRRFPLK